MCVLSEGRSEVAASPYPFVHKVGHTLDDHDHHVVPPPLGATGVSSRQRPLLPSGGTRPFGDRPAAVDRSRVPVSALTVSPLGLKLSVFGTLPIHGHSITWRHRIGAVCLPRNYQPVTTASPALPGRAVARPRRNLHMPIHLPF